MTVKKVHGNEINVFKKRNENNCRSEYKLCEGGGEGYMQEGI